MEENFSDTDNMVQTEVEEDDNGNDSDDKNKYNDYSDGGLISSFCQLDGNEYFVEISEEFLRNRTNLYGIPKHFKHFNYLLDLILSDDGIDESNNEEINQNLPQLKELYGMIHARFITTAQGLALVREKYLNGVYGVCPRILCNKQVVLPIGLSNDTKYSRVKIFCPRCEEIYNPKHRLQDMDGAFFGINFPQMFLINYPDLKPFTNNNFNKTFIPKLYGFKIYGKKGSKFYRGDNIEKHC